MANGLSKKLLHNRLRTQIGVIVLNFNGSDFTLRCVQSVLLKTAESVDYRILVLDNGSDSADHSKLVSLESQARVDVVYSKINLGFGGGHQFALQFLDAEYYLFLNSDCVFCNDVLSVFLDFMRNNPKAALTSGINVDVNGRFKPNYHPAPHIAELLFGRKLLRVFNPERYPSRRERPTEPIQVEVLGGAALFVRSKAYCEIGGFDPFYFLYCEEEDLALRLRRAGWEVWLAPKAVLQHDGGASTPASRKYEREFFISFLYYFRKNHGSVTMSIMQLIYAIKLFKRGLFCRSYFELAWFVLKGASPSVSLRYQQYRSS